MVIGVFSFSFQGLPQFTFLTFPLKSLRCFFHSVTNTHASLTFCNQTSVLSSPLQRSKSVEQFVSTQNLISTRQHHQDMILYCLDRNIYPLKISFCRSQNPMLGRDSEKDLLSFISKPSTKCSFFRCRELKATYPCVPHLQHKRSQNVHWLQHFIISRSSTTFDLFSVLERKRTFTQPGAFFKKQLGSSVEKEL